MAAFVSSSFGGRPLQKRAGLLEARNAHAQVRPDGRNRATVVMRGRPGPPGRRGPQDDNKGFLENEIVQKEWKAIYEAHQSLAKLGANYGKFDKRGKLMFVQQWKEVLERYEIHLKRYELSDDFSAQLFMKQMDVQLEPMGMDRRGMVQAMRRALEMMEKDAEDSSW